MVIRYPNGRIYQKQQRTKTHIAEPSFANRGQTLEQQIEEANEYYLEKELAVIHKKPVPIQIVNVHYPARSAARITEAYFKTPSTTDFNGIWNGIHIDFEAKETKNKTSFPLANIHPHQVEHMGRVARQNGVVFFIFKFATLSRYFLFFYEDFEPFWTRMLQGGRKSITLSEVENNSYELQVSAYPELHYLPIIEQYMKQKER